MGLLHKVFTLYFLLLLIIFAACSRGKQLSTTSTVNEQVISDPPPLQMESQTLQASPAPIAPLSCEIQSSTTLGELAVDTNFLPVGNPTVFSLRVVSNRQSLLKTVSITPATNALYLPTQLPNAIATEHSLSIGIAAVGHQIVQIHLDEPSGGSTSCLLPVFVEPVQTVVSAGALSPEDIDYVQQAYADVLGRPATGEELNIFSVQDIRERLASSLECAAAVDLLTRNTLGRPVDPVLELPTIRKALVEGASLVKIRAVMAVSTEASSRIRDLYQQVLGRDADDYGMDYYTERLISGMPLADIRLFIASGTECSDRVENLYMTILERHSDPSGLEFHIQTIKDGATLSQVRHTFAYSSEAGNRLNDVYRHLLCRDIDSSGLDSYRALLAGGMSLEAVRRDIRASSEYNSRLNRCRGH